MSCPHSTARGASPSTCSQCLQATTAFDVHRVSVENGRVVIDGEDSGVTVAQAMNYQRERETADFANPFYAKRLAKS